MPRLKWKWLWIHDRETGLVQLIELLNLRLKALAQYLDTLVTGTRSGSIEFFGYNSGATLLPGDSDWGYLPVASSISGAELVVAPSGSITITVSTARYPTWETWTVITPTPITLASATKAQPSISGWTADLIAGTYMKVTVVGAPSHITQFTLTLFLTPA